MAKKPEPSTPPETPSAFPATGGSYIADEAAGLVRQVDPPAAAAPARRGCGEPEPSAPAMTPAAAVTKE